MTPPPSPIASSFGSSASERSRKRIARHTNAWPMSVWLRRRLLSRKQSCPYGRNLPACDRVFFVGAERLVEVPAVEVGAVDRRSDVEVWFERRDDSLERMQVRPM